LFYSALKYHCSTADDSKEGGYQELVERVIINRSGGEGRLMTNWKVLFPKWSYIVNPLWVINWKETPSSLVTPP